MSPSCAGACSAEVTRGSPALRAGIHVFDVSQALADPAYLSTDGIDLRGDSERYEAGEDGMRAATFSGDRLVCATDARLAVFALPTGETIQVHEVDTRPGTQLMAWGRDHVVAFDGCPRMIELATGAVVHIWEDLDGGSRLHQPDANMKPPAPPWIARDPAKPRFALGWPDRIVIVTG